MKSTSSLLLTALLLLTACSDPEPSSNNDAPDMAPDTTPDLMTPDMRPTPAGPQDCLATEWFSTDGPTCVVCPAPALTCDALVLSTASINPTADTITFDLNLALLQPTSATLKGQLVETLQVSPPVGQPAEPPQDMPPAPFEAALTITGKTASATFTQTESYDNTYIVESVEIVDKCGVTHRFSMMGGWKMREDRLTAPLNCVAPAP
jgi:hypothetical protein